MKLARIGFLAVAVALGAATATAQEIQWGVHGGVNVPLGDLDTAVDGRPGVTLGGHVGLYFGNGHEVRPRLDYTYYSGGTPKGPGLDKSNISAWGLGADYLYYTSTHPLGLYLTGGLGFQSWTVEPEHSSSSSHTSLSLAAGAGYRFSRSFALEGRFTTSEFQSGSGQANAIQALASIRF